MRKNILLYLPVKALCIAAILLLCMTESGLSAQSPFIIKYTFASGSSDVLFYAQTSGSTPYTYKVFDASNTQIGTDGSGSFTQAGYALTIITLSPSVPAGGSVVLSLGQSGLLRYGNGGGTVLATSYITALTDVVQWGSAAWNSTVSMFQNCTGLTTLSATDVPNLSSVSDMTNMFSNASQLKTVPNIGSWNTSKVTNMSHMFEYTSFNGNIGSWNTSNVTNMSSMFNNAAAFNGNIGNWNTSKVQYMLQMFYGAAAFNQDISYKQGQGVPGPKDSDAWNTSGVTNMSSMFQLATAFNGNIGNWNTSNVTNMLAMFSGAAAFNQDISYKQGQGAPGPDDSDAWNTSKVTNMSSMFFGATVFNQDIGSWNTSGVKNMSQMFRAAPAFNQDISYKQGQGATGPADSDAWNTSGVTSMYAMFQAATAFNQDIGHWNTSNVTNMGYMFSGATVFNKDISYKPAAGAQGLEDSDAWKTSKVTDMGSMFFGASAFNRNIGSWTLNPAVIMTGMLNGSGLDCANYSSTLQGWAANNPTVTGRTLGAQGMKYNPLDAPTVAARSQLVTGQGWTITGDSATGSCLSPTPFIVKYTFLAPDPNNPNDPRNNAQFYSNVQFYVQTDTGGTQYTYEMFDASNASMGTVSGSFTQTAYGLMTIALSPSVPVGGSVVLKLGSVGLLRYGNSDASSGFSTSYSTALTDVLQWGSAAWNSTAYMFLSTGLTALKATDMPDLSRVQDMSAMFANVTQLTDVPNINSWDTSNVTNMFAMFSSVSASVFNQNIGNWNTSKVENMAQMFWNATAFNQDIGNWNTSKVEDMSYMFTGATVFNQNIGNWNTSSVKYMNRMFYAASAFNQNISYKPGAGPGGSEAWNTSQVEDMSWMFASATAFNQNIGNWNTSQVEDMSIMFQNATAFNQDISYKHEQGAPGPADSDAWNTSSVTDMQRMFQNATAFNQDIGNWNTSQVEDMAIMFSSATAFNQDISYKQGAGPGGSDAWDTSSVKDMTQMFRNAIAFNQNIGSWKLNPDAKMLIMLDNSGIDCTNYSRTLQGWAANNPTVTERQLGADGRVYNPLDAPTATARNKLTDPSGMNWTITGDSATGNCLTTYLLPVNPNIRIRMR